MLRSLYIQNYALIEKLDIGFETGFSVITGETGAGKSIILGAIGLLLGQRADVKAIRRGASKCIIEARFDISAYGMRPFFEENELEYDDEECILRREVQASGKSRAFINDTPASLAQVKELGEQLIDVHSQHQNLLLNKEGFQLNVLDILAHNDDALEKYHLLYNEWKLLDRELSELTALAEQSRTDEDYLRFQLEQLEEAHLVEGEQSELEQEAETLSHAEEIKAGLYRIEQSFFSDEGGLLSFLKESHPELVDNSDFIAARADSAAEAYSEAIHTGSTHDAATEIADQVLFAGLHFSKYNVIVTVLWNEFSDEVPQGNAQSLALQLLPVCEEVFAKYPLSDDFLYEPAFDNLYTEITGTILIWLDEYGIQ